MRFGLRSLLIAVTAFGVFAGMVSNKAAHYRRQATTIHELRKQGHGLFVDLVQPHWFWKVVAGKDAGDVQAIFLDESIVNPRYSHYLPEAEVMRFVANLASLKEIYFPAFYVTGDIPSGLEGPALSKYRLRVHTSYYGDEGLVMLHSMKNLERIWIRNPTQITASGIDSLMLALPKCHIAVDRRTDGALGYRIPWLKWYE